MRKNLEPTTPPIMNSDNRYTYGESNYSPIVVHSKKGDYKNGTTVATPIVPNWDRGKTEFRNKETFLGDKLSAFDYVEQIAEYYQIYYKEDWPELQKAYRKLEENGQLGDLAAVAVADALQEGENPLEALKMHFEEKKGWIKSMEI